MKKKKRMKIFLIVLTAILAAAGIWVGMTKFDWEKPSLQLLSDSMYVGQKISFKAEDRRSGVAEVRIDLLQQGKTVTLLAEHLPKETRRIEKTVLLQPLPQGLREGEAQLRIYARDHSWSRNSAVIERNVIIDTVPPRLSVFGAQHYINQGGTGFVAYQTSEEAPVNGVQAGDIFFPGCSTGKDIYLDYFAAPYGSPPDMPFSVIAEDRAGNRTKSAFRPVVRHKGFKKEKILITDSFLKKVIPYFVERNPSLKGTSLDIFLAVNQKERMADHQKIRELCRNTEAKPLWSGPFLRLPNSKPMASFGSVRTYWYEGRQVDQQVHLGVDLASNANSPVPAANSGRVIFAGPLGIYGNTVMIDHGCGLVSMYSHLGSIETEVKKEVKKGEFLGHTGVTGMSSGDHLHFSMLVRGVFVNPIEWWDEHWIKDNIEKKMEPLHEGAPAR